MSASKIKIIWLLLISLFTINCFSFDLKKMEIQLIKRTPLSLVPSASGVEYIAANIFVIGDDSPWLFKLDDQLNLVSKTEIYSLSEDINAIIPKLIKPDFEAMTIVKSDNKNELYLFGSGSKSPTRDVLVKTNLENLSDLSTYSLTKFYSLIKKECNLTDAELNIEGAFSNDKNIYLLNRGKNLIIWFNIDAFSDFVIEKTETLNLYFQSYELPTVKNVQAGFSGATFVQKHNLILFTASIENTSNWIDDGEVLGSFIGAISLNDLDKITSPNCIPITENGKSIAIKIESIAVKSLNKNSVTLILVTDSDGGTSEIIEASLQFN